MKISEHRASFFKHMLSLLLTIVMLVSDLGLGSFAAVDRDGTDPAVASEIAEDTLEANQTGSTEPTNPGYTFGGWYSDAACTDGNEVQPDDTSAGTHYAKWIPNTYTVRFSANTSNTETPPAGVSQWVTEAGEGPADGAEPINSMDYYWVYDAAPSEDAGTGAEKFWTLTDGGAEKHHSTLPTAWREGCVFVGWQTTDASGKVHILTDADKLNKDLMNELEINNHVDSSTDNSTPALTLYASYEKISAYFEGETPHTLKNDSSVGNAWTITYGEGKTLPSGESVSVDPLSVVTLKPELGSDALPLTLTVDDGITMTTKSLASLVEPEGTDDTNVFDFEVTKEKNGSYTFKMPSKNVTVSTVWELYLEAGTIELSPKGFRQLANDLVSITEEDWEGDYRILQCKGDNPIQETPNVLKLHGNLTEQQISLGNLKISGDNSIELIYNGVEETEVVLTQKGKIQAKNILVPENTRLTLNGNYKRDAAGTAAGQTAGEGTEGSNIELKNITLTPNAGRAAIGGSSEKTKNGDITLNNVELSMTLDATSNSGCSGIGPVKNGGTNSSTNYGKVSVTDSKITVIDNGPQGEAYTRAWIGGTGVEVSVDNTTLLNEGNKDKYSAYAVDGKNVTLTGCDFGIIDKTHETLRPIKAPIHADEKLKISDCRICQ